MSTSFVTPWIVAHQAPLSVEFSRQEYRSELPFPSPGDLPNPGIKPGSLELQEDSLSSEPPGKPSTVIRLKCFFTRLQGHMQISSVPSDSNVHSIPSHLRHLPKKKKKDICQASAYRGLTSSRRYVNSIELPSNPSSSHSRCPATYCFKNICFNNMCVTEVKVGTGISL